MSTANRVVTDFRAFAVAINAQFVKMSASELFVTRLDKDELFTAYLDAFPDGTNPMFRERTEHDCNTCKQFIRNLGRVVAIENGELTSVWEAEDLGYPYNEVAAKLHSLVTERQIVSVFRTKEHQYGAPFTYEAKDGKPVKTWHHLFGQVASRHRHTSPGEDIGRCADIYQVFRRGVTELTKESMDTVMDLITSNSLYRGEEHKTALASFMFLRERYAMQRTARAKDLFLWANLDAPHTRLRNAVIGSLLIDLSEGVNLETAVRSFESKVAPVNYKRPTAIVTPAMVEQAMQTLTACEAEDSLYRRHAVPTDISVNNVEHADVSVRGQMKDGVAGIMESIVQPRKPNFKNAREISVDDFVQQVLPNVTTVELWLTRDMMGNFMSLTAPQVSEAPNIFKWDNNFAWSYDGNVADSIKERVKAAGGNVNAKYRVSLGWFNHDDLDIHAETPSGHIFYGNKRGVLDVDMNAGFGKTRTPVENLSWNHLEHGDYSIFVHNFSKRESTNVGFEVEVDLDGDRYELSYDKALKSNERVYLMEFKFTSSGIQNLKIRDGVKHQMKSVEKWGVKTEALVRTSMILWSPNHWDDNEVGNRHLFFILDGCLNPDPVRGMYNEFLNSNFEKHRKVFEILADKMKCQYSNIQLSGVGFSTTRRQEVLIMTYSGKRPTAYKVMF